MGGFKIAVENENVSFETEHDVFPEVVMRFRPFLLKIMCNFLKTKERTSSIARGASVTANKVFVSRIVGIVTRNINWAGSITGNVPSRGLDA